MALTVEDGTGVTGADAFVSLTDADALHLAREGSAWSGTDPDKEAAIRRATTWVSAQRFKGSKTLGRNQGLAWPREGASDGDGFEIAKDEIPHEVEDATAVLAFAELSSPGILTPQVNRSEIVTRTKVGPIEREVSGGAGSADFARTIITAAVDILKPLMVNVKFISRA